MRTFMCALMLTLVGCATVQPSPGWYISNNKTTWSAACFKDPAGLSKWNFCGLRTGETKAECEILALASYGGEILPPHTSVSVYVHASNGYSKVLISSGDFTGETLWCPTVRIRKE